MPLPNAIGNKFMEKNPRRESKELPEKDKCHYQIYISIKVNIHRAVKNFTV